MIILPNHPRGFAGGLSSDGPGVSLAGYRLPARGYAPGYRPPARGFAPGYHPAALQAASGYPHLFVESFGPPDHAPLSSGDPGFRPPTRGFAPGYHPAALQAASGRIRPPNTLLFGGLVACALIHPLLMWLPAIWVRWAAPHSLGGSILLTQVGVSHMD